MSVAHYAIQLPQSHLLVLSFSIFSILIAHLECLISQLICYSCLYTLFLCKMLSVVENKKRKRKKRKGNLKARKKENTSYERNPCANDICDCYNSK